MRHVVRILSAALLVSSAGTGCSLLTVASPIDAAHVRTIVNPYGIAPLVALLNVSSAAGIVNGRVHRIDVSVTAADRLTTTWSLPYGTAGYAAAFDVSDLPIPPDDLVIPILGLSPDGESAVSVAIFVDGSRRRYEYATTITTAMATDKNDPLRDGYPDVAVAAATRTKMEPGMTLVSFSMGDNGRFVTRPFLVDSAGGIRWVLRLDSLQNWASPVEPLANGNLVLGRGERVYEYSMLGRQVHAWDIGRYGFTQHHDVFEVTKGARKGDLLIAVDRIKADTVEDFIIEIDRTGALVATWDLRQVLDTDRGDVLKNASDWFHMNALLYDERDDSLIISGRNQGVVKVDRANGLTWILAPHQGWGAAGPAHDGPDTAPSLLTAVSASGDPYGPEVQQGKASVDEGGTFDWPWGQHAVELLPNGDLLMFDNGFNRLFGGQQAGRSRAVEYRVDEKTRTVRQVWQYGLERGDDYYSAIISDTDVLPRTKNRLITSGSIRNSANGPHAYITEITYPAGAVVFEARLGFKDAHSDLAAGGWGNMDIIYRAERLSLYPGVKSRGG